MARKFHITTGMASMITWNVFPDKASLLSRDDFSKYCYKLLADRYSKRDITCYLFDVKLHTKSADEHQTKELEALLSCRLTEYLNNNFELLLYDFSGDEALLRNSMELNQEVTI
ncbi:hypothetical protein ACNUDM_21415 [Vibrio chaetopteri]|uniref:hypothetical protein n=1 Tax=Vibrio chaetopteri TaxID=3016528 RepID=UPI003AB491F9